MFVKSHPLGSHPSKVDLRGQFGPIPLATEAIELMVCSVGDRLPACAAVKGEKFGHSMRRWWPQGNRGRQAYSLPEGVEL